MLGGGDPCDLAINYGKAWAALGNLWSRLEQFFVIKKRDVEIQCDFEASQYDWDIRNMIWDFKANPHKPMSIETIMRLHKDVISVIVDNMEKCLNHFFGEDTKYLTLVCVPSSQAVINQRRYEDFACINSIDKLFHLAWFFGFV